MTYATFGRVIILILAVFGESAWSQDVGVARASRTFDDATRSGRVTVARLYGDIIVEGYSGREVRVEARAREAGDPRSADGTSALGLRIEGSGNDLRVYVANRLIDLRIRVPRQTSLVLSTVEAGEIRVTNIVGDVEASNINGSITLLSIDGVAVLDTINGDISASFTRVAPDRPMAFSSMNGTLSISLPSSASVDLYLETENGEIHSDFSLRPTSRSSLGRRGRWMKVNGGGARISLTSVYGDLNILSIGH